MKLGQTKKKNKKFDFLVHRSPDWAGILANFSKKFQRRYLKKYSTFFLAFLKTASYQWAVCSEQQNKRLRYFSMNYEFFHN